MAFSWRPRAHRLGQAASRRLSSWLMTVGTCAARDGNVMLEPGSAAGARRRVAIRDRESPQSRSRVRRDSTNQMRQSSKTSTAVLYRFRFFRSEKAWGEATDKTLAIGGTCARLSAPQCAKNLCGACPFVGTKVLWSVFFFLNSFCQIPMGFPSPTGFNLVPSDFLWVPLCRICFF